MDEKLAKIQKAQNVMEQYQDSWFEDDNVQGISVDSYSDGRIIISVLVDEEPIEGQFPKEIDGFPVEIQVGGLKLI